MTAFDNIACGVRWTDDELDRLRRMWRDGTSVKTIVRKLGRSRDSVIRKRVGLGLAPRHARGARPRAEPVHANDTGQSYMSLWTRLTEDGDRAFAAHLARAGLPSDCFRLPAGVTP